MEERALADFHAHVDAVRIGTVIAHDRKAAQRWDRRSRPGKKSRGLTGAALEQAVLGLAATHPEYVVMA